MNNNRISREELLLTQAALIALRGTCGRLKVGCVITREGRVIATGYNGPLKTEGHCDMQCLGFSGDGCKSAVHAEANAIAHAARYGIALAGAEIWTTHCPCRDCSELIIQAGISHVHYMYDFRDNYGKKTLERFLQITKHDEPPMAVHFRYNDIKEGN